MSRARDKANSTVSNFASTGIDDNADATAITIDSSENLLVGTTTFDTANAGHAFTAAGFAHHTRDANKVLILNRKTNDGDILEIRKDDTAVGSIGVLGGIMDIDGSANLGVGAGDTGLLFTASSDDIRPFNVTTGSTRDAAIDLGSSSRRFANLYLSGGAYLGGTGSSNLLNDFETGSWTPAFDNTVGNGPTVTYTTQIGRYTKVGNRVHWTATIRWSAFTVNGSGYVKLVGFPFNAVTLSGFSQGANFFGYASGIGGSNSLQGLYIDGNTNFFYLTTSANPTAELAVSNVSGSGIFFCGGSVIV